MDGTGAEHNKNWKKNQQIRSHKNNQMVIKISGREKFGNN